MSDIFGHRCSRNTHPLRPGQDCTTLCDYLKDLSPAWKILSLEWRQLLLQQAKNELMVQVQHLEIVMFSTEHSVSHIISPQKPSKNSWAHAVFTHKICHDCCQQQHSRLWITGCRWDWFLSSFTWCDECAACRINIASWHDLLLSPKNNWCFWLDM